MPIRINLLAEQQAAEEMRRRDPVKRAIWGAVAVVALVLLWSMNLQLKVRTARSEVSRLEDQWKQMTPEFITVSNNVKEVGAMRKKIESLQKYTTNRFLWANVLNALQNTAEEHVRIVRFEGMQTFEMKPQAVLSTNIALMRPPKSWWQWWEKPMGTNINDLARPVLGLFTNKVELLPFQSHLVSSLNVTTTKVQVVAKVEVIKPDTMTERINLSILGRDYSGRKSMDDFHQKLVSSPFFSKLVPATNWTPVMPESYQPRSDITDTFTDKEFIQFSIKGKVPDRIRSNE